MSKQSNAPAGPPDCPQNHFIASISGPQRPFAGNDWLCGERLTGKRKSKTGERRLTANPFDGFGTRDERSDRRRVARGLTIDELRRLLDVAGRRPPDDALTIRRGPRQGQRAAHVADTRRVALIRLGRERALTYKTALLTGLWAGELGSLRVRDLSFGDVPLIVLRSEDEKNRRGSMVPIRSDLASDLRAWIDGTDRKPTDALFDVADGLLRILNRDLAAAGIAKIDDLGGRVHVHALRHSTGTHLSAGDVAPRTAQTLMRHSTIDLTMNIYTDARLLDTAAAVERLPSLPIAGGSMAVPPANRCPNGCPRCCPKGSKLVRR